MNSESRYDSFVQTRSTWLSLASAGVLWAGLCFWTLNAIGFIPAEQESGQDAGRTQSSTLDRPASAQAEAEEKARLAAQVELEEQVRRAAQAQAEEKARLALNTNPVAEQASRAAAEASRVAALARQQREYERSREEELKILSGLSLRIRFAPGSFELTQDIQRALDNIFDLLYIYSGWPVEIAVATNEYDGTASDNVLSRERGQAVSQYLVRRGLEKARIRILIETGDDLMTGMHRIQVSTGESRR